MLCFGREERDEIWGTTCSPSASETNIEKLCLTKLPSDSRALGLGLETRLERPRTLAGPWNSHDGVELRYASRRF